MKDYAPSTYGERIADVFDDWYETLVDPGPAADFLGALAGGGRVLELGVGTGRVALVLGGRGLDVHGIDASPAMLAKLVAKPSGQSVTVSVGDYADVAVEGEFALIYAAFNTFFWLTSQSEQLRCLRNVADHLPTGGLFILDAFVPDPTRYDGGQTATVTEIEQDQVTIDVSRHDHLDQTITASHLVLSERGVKLHPVVIRYAWPSELDAMALSSGLELAHRYEDYLRRPFEHSSTQHVSVYRKP
jgi:SAM-dependent methyltransferase